MPPSLPPPGPPPLPPFLFCLGPFFFLFLSLSLSFHAAFPRIFRRIKGVSLWIFFHRSMGQWQQSVIRISRLGFYACNVMIRHNRERRKSSRKDRCKSPEIIADMFYFSRYLSTRGVFDCEIVGEVAFFSVKTIHSSSNFRVFLLVQWKKTKTWQKYEIRHMFWPQ